MPFIAAIICGALFSSAGLVRGFPQNAKTLASESDIVNIRIEGLNNTIYEAPIYSGPRNITTKSGGTHLCDGTNGGANPTPGNTCTDALDAASKLARFPYDGTFDAEFDDFFITSISTTTETATEFWGLLLDFQFTPVGGCQQEVAPGQDVLWAFNAFNKNYFLKVTPNTIVEATVGSSHVVTVTDGMTGVPIEGALIDGVLTDASGDATLTFPKAGVFEFKAERSDSIRSNALYVAVA
ncbi:MAG: hypothetical protein ALECFALPRED_009591 [Alectoria fallacina]|uniref:Uncharacterized protein n=1 Tax=Alectoria fallacina TaxID=1903189 RepID=A0A8H3EZT6_9LECA|nr:MAG: hypothetical protein ALECFALPRED_009591 [Alectoria fallacina]